MFYCSADSKKSWTRYCGSWFMTRKFLFYHNNGWQLISYVSLSVVRYAPRRRCFQYWKYTTYNNEKIGRFSWANYFISNYIHIWFYKGMISTKKTSEKSFVSHASSSKKIRSENGIQLNDDARSFIQKSKYARVRSDCTSDTFVRN